MSFRECPSKWLSRQRETLALLNDWRWLQEYKALPNEGGLLDQSPRFIEAVDLIDQELTKLKGVIEGGEAK